MKMRKFPIAFLMVALVCCFGIAQAQKAGSAVKTDISGKPVFQDTGNPEVDQANYTKAKQTWIESHPGDYAGLQKQAVVTKKVPSVSGVQKLDVSTSSNGVATTAKGSAKVSLDSPFSYTHEASLEVDHHSEAYHQNKLDLMRKGEDAIAAERRIQKEEYYRNLAEKQTETANGERIKKEEYYRKLAEKQAEIVNAERIAKETASLNNKSGKHIISASEFKTMSPDKQANIKAHPELYEIK